MADKLVRLNEVRDIPSNGTQPQPHSWQPNNLLQLAANPPEPPTIGGLLYPGKRTVLSGETESMKTWLALILCKAELDIDLPVVWVDLDAMGPGAMLERLQLLGVTDQQLDHFHYIQPAEQLDPPKIAELQTLIANTGARLCVIDAFNPILSLHDLDPNSTPDIETFWRTIADPIAAAGAAPVLLDHVTKNAEARGKYSYGSERKASGAIVHIGFRPLEPLTKTAGSHGRTLLTVHKDRPGYLTRPTLGRLILTNNGDQISYQLEPDKSHDGERFRPTILMERISQKLELHGEPVSQTWIEKNTEGKGSALRTAVEVLVDEGYVTRTAGPNKTLNHTVTRPYRQDEDTTQPSPSPARPQSVPELRSSESVPPSHPLTGDGDGPRRGTGTSPARPTDPNDPGPDEPNGDEPFLEYDIDPTLGQPDPDELPF